MGAKSRPTRKADKHAAVAPGQTSHGFLRDSLIVARYIWDHPANRGIRLRVLTRAVLLQLRGRLLGKPTVVPCGRRSRIEIHPREGSSGLAYANPPEKAEIEVWSRTLRPGDLFIDVGANVGAYTMWAIEAGADVVAIEPDASAASRLRRNLAINDYAARVLEVAVSDREGEASFTTGLGVLNHLARGPGYASRKVRTLTLDSILGTEVAAGVKVDVEGAEEFVILGASAALREKRIRLLQLEWNPASEITYGRSRQDLGALIRSFGYELLRPDEAGLLRPIEWDGPGPDIFARPQ